MGVSVGWWALSHLTFVPIEGRTESHGGRVLVFSERSVSTSARQLPCSSQAEEAEGKGSPPAAAVATVPAQAP